MNWRRIGLLAVVVVSATVSAAADKRFRASWMQVDAERKLLIMPFVAGWNPANGALNFNGYYNGQATVVVPVGWTVLAKFKNQDGMLPHSVLVTRAYSEQDMPVEAGLNEVAIPRAYSIDPIPGIMAPRGDDVRFVARDAGQFLLFCGVTGHGQGGMWIRLEVSATAAAPELVVAAGAAPGWE